MSMSAVTLVIHTNVMPDSIDKLVYWQQQVKDVLATFPGYLDQPVIPPSSGNDAACR